MPRLQAHGAQHAALAALLLAATVPPAAAIRRPHASPTLEAGWQALRARCEVCEKA
jgi:hypothetical protein